MLEDYPDIMTVHEVMEVLGISKNTLYALIHNRTIQRIPDRIKNLERYGRLTLIDYLNDQ